MAITALVLVYPITCGWRDILKTWFDLQLNVDPNQ